MNNVKEMIDRTVGGEFPSRSHPHKVNTPHGEVKYWLDAHPGGPVNQYGYAVHVEHDGKKFIVQTQLVTNMERGKTYSAH